MIKRGGPALGGVPSTGNGTVLTAGGVVPPLTAARAMRNAMATTEQKHHRNVFPGHIAEATRDSRGRTAPSRETFGYLRLAAIDVSSSAPCGALLTAGLGRRAGEAGSEVEAGRLDIERYAGACASVK
jgi:hypothetical protein